MDKKIPIYFDEAVIINSPIQEIVNSEESTISRLKVGAFYKYKNRNGSYITDEYADFLIKSATRGNVPVVGFFDPNEQEWASHTGPTLANGYGYIESFLGWEPFTDTDGKTREYAVFSVILFTEYFEAARKVLGQHQSMELDPTTIEGDWARFGNEEYFVYTKGNMSSFCIIGAHEPCFSVSSFFEKNDEIFNTQIEKFSSLLSDLKTVVEEAEKNDKGGEQPMNEFENQAVVEQVENPQVQEEAQNTFQADAGQSTEETTTVAEPTEAKTESAETNTVEETTTETEENEEPSEFEVLQNQFNELQTNYTALQQDYETAQARIAELEEAANIAAQNYEALQNTNAELQNSLAAYESQNEAREENRKNELVEKYEKILNAEEITTIRDSIKDFSYDELESKLAIQFANQQMAHTEPKKVPLVEQKDNSFANLMSKYRKN